MHWPSLLVFTCLASTPAPTSVARSAGRSGMVDSGIIKDSGAHLVVLPSAACPGRGVG